MRKYSSNLTKPNGDMLFWHFLFIKNLPTKPNDYTVRAIKLENIT